MLQCWAASIIDRHPNGVVAGVADLGLLNDLLGVENRSASDRESERASHLESQRVGRVSESQRLARVSESQIEVMQGGIAR